MTRSLRSWLWRVPVEQEVDEEIAFHLEMRARELIARGMDPAAAREMARARAGDVDRLRRSCVDIGRKRDREMRLTLWLEELRDDVTFGLRQLRAAKTFTAVAVVTLALGVGANTAVFSVLKSVLLDALPYADADRLMRVFVRRSNLPTEQGPLSARLVSDVVQRQRSFERMAAFQALTGPATYGDESGAQVATVAWVEPHLLETLGVSPAHGRTFRAAEATSASAALTGGRVSDTARVVVLTHPGWQRLLGGAADVVGREVRINGLPRTVIGVLPAGFVGPMGNADFYLPFDLAPVVAHPVAGRGAQWLGLVGRLGDGAPPEAAHQDLSRIASQLAGEDQRDANLRFLGLPLRDALVGDTGTPLLVLMASAGLVLLITCANLAGALLSRFLTRQRELAVRAALGAGRGRVLRQLLTESTVLAVLGAAVGLGVAELLLGALRELSIAALPAYADLSLDRGTVLAAAALALSAGLAFGLAPALAASSSGVGRVASHSRGASEGRRSGRIRGVLMAGQMALCASLLVGAGLLGRSLWEMRTGPLGFDGGGVLAFTVNLPGQAYPPGEPTLRFHEQVAERLQAQPDVEAVATTNFPPTAVLMRMGFSSLEPASPDTPQPSALYGSVSDNYFRVLGIPLKAGRTFDARDRADSPPALVVSESFARQHFPDGGALHARLRIGPNPAAPPVEIIGIVGDVRNDLARPDAEPVAYRSHRQDPWPIMTFLVKTRGEPRGLLDTAKRELAAIDPGLPIQRAASLEDIVGSGLAGRRLPVLLMTAFGGLALLLASVGVYAMFAGMTAAREREFGVRMALGSSPRAIAQLVLRQGAGWMAAGLAGGGAGIVLVVRLVGDLLYQVSPFDPVTLAGSIGVLTGCAALALFMPVRRATRVDPAIALRAQ